MVWVDHRAGIEGLTFRALALPRSEWMSCGWCGVCMQSGELCCWWRLGCAGSGGGLIE